ncbi:MAG TPA: OmpA family protein [Candidatus Ozemobacteraceae bacterium]|nr:OmpA family protein [Candidatus Ozemobacteraceae bacterium]
MNILYSIHKSCRWAALVLVFWSLCVSPALAAEPAKRYDVTFGQQGNEVQVQLVPARAEVASQTMPAAGDPAVDGIVGSPAPGATTAVSPAAARPQVPLKSQSVVEYKEDGFDVNIDGMAGEALSSDLDASGRVSVDGILFDFSLAEIKPASLPALNTILTMLRNRPTLKIRIEGFTDYRGPVDYNFVLSVQRAYAVKSWLVDHGIPSTRITYVGRGQRGNAGDTEEQQAKNRRVDIVKISE